MESLSLISKGAEADILLDPDWNPATDAQAMARVWRDGQKKNVVIYRLFSTASIEEKILQRQMKKGELASAVADGKQGMRKKSKFKLNPRAQITSSARQIHPID